MTPRWMRISYLIFGLVWLTLGTLSLIDGDTGTGIIQLALGIAWLLVAAFKVMRSATPGEVNASEEIDRRGSR